MGRPRGVRRLLRLREGKRWAEEEVELEFAHHLESRVEELIGEGHSPGEARRMAEGAFGPPARYRDECVAQRRQEARMMKGRELFGEIAGDLHYALRGLRRQPGFAAAVVVTLGLGIGANTAVFAVVDHMLIRDVPFERPDELYDVQAQMESGFRLPDVFTEAALALDAADIGRVFRSAGFSVVRDDGPQPTTLTVVAFDPGLPDMLGVTPKLGRPFNVGDALLSAGRTAILSHGYWSQAFGQDPEVVGRTLVLDSIPVTVVGVMGASFRYPLQKSPALYVPLAPDGTALGREFVRLATHTRLAPDEVTRAGEAARAFLAAFHRERGESEPWEPVFVSMNHPRIDPDVRQALYVSFGAVSLMMLVALVNGMNLMLVRGMGRSREIGVRLALGGSRRRVVRQVLAESFVLAVVSGLAALVLAAVGIRFFWSMAPNELTFFGGQNVSVDQRVLLFAASLAGVAGLVFGLVPAVRAATADTSMSASSLSVHAHATRAGSRARGSSTVLQVAVTLTLLFGAALLAKSFSKLVRQDPGIEIDGLITMNVFLSPGRYAEADERATFARQVVERLRGIPGITDVTVGWSELPGGASTLARGLYVEGKADPVFTGELILPVAVADPNLRATLGSELLAGRDLRPEDREGGRRALITIALARRLGAVVPGEAVGLRFALAESFNPIEVVGVIEDARIGGMDTRYGREAFFQLASQDEPGYGLGFLVRTDRPFDLIRTRMTEAVHGIDPGQPIADFGTVDELLRDSVDEPRFFMTLMGAFATIALLLAAVGLYGTLSFSVRQRHREMGIRVALGAAASDVRWMVLRRGLLLALVGTVLGGVLAIALSRILEGLLFETPATDFGVLLTTAAVLVASAAAASYMPARRATRVNPVEVLKAE